MPTNSKQKWKQIPRPRSILASSNFKVAYPGKNKDLVILAEKNTEKS